MGSNKGEQLAGLLSRIDDESFCFQGKKGGEARSPPTEEQTTSFLSAGHIASSYSFRNAPYVSICSQRQRPFFYHSQLVMETTETKTVGYYFPVSVPWQGTAICRNRRHEVGERGHSPPPSVVRFCRFPEAKGATFLDDASSSRADMALNPEGNEQLRMLLLSRPEPNGKLKRLLSTVSNDAEPKPILVTAVNSGCFGRYQSVIAHRLTRLTSLAVVVFGLRNKVPDSKCGFLKNDPN